MANTYRIGRRAERKLANQLRERNYRNVRLSKGSRGPADVYGVKNGVKTYIQVKANSARETRDERAALRRLAKKEEAGRRLSTNARPEPDGNYSAISAGEGDNVSNRTTHIALGFLFGAAGYCIVKKLQNEEINVGNALGWGVVGAGVAVLPDIIEPATSPTHRAFTHSLVAAGAATYVTKKAWDSQELSGEQKAAAASIFGAYMSHLLADSTTPAGLPIA